MGKRFPNENISLIGPFPYFTFSLIGMVASIVVITSLCGVRFRRKSQLPPRTVSNVAETMNASTPPILNTIDQVATPRISISPEQPYVSEVTKLDNTTKSPENNELLTKELPLPPAMQQANIRDSTIVKRTKSERRLSFNLSMKKPRSFSMARNRDHKEEYHIGKKEKLKADESVWMKTIILGEKCNPDDQENVVIYEGKGMKIAAYHPRNSTSTMSLSRQCSSIALDTPQPSSHDNV